MPTNGHSSLLRATRARPRAQSLDERHRHTVAVDIVLFTIQDRALKALVIKRERSPFEGSWALPGGLVHRDEAVDAAALRELRDETGITSVYLEQLYTFGDLGRDPRGRVITVSYYAAVDWEQFQLKAKPRSAAQWVAVNALPALAFDHTQIVHYALERLRNKVNYTSVGFQLLPHTFSLTQLQRAYEVILDQPLDKRNFRKKMLQLGILKDAGQQRAAGRRRPAKLYSFAQSHVVKLQEKGILVPF